MKQNTKCKQCNGTGWIATNTGYKECICVIESKTKKLWNNFGVNPDDVKKLSDYKPYNAKTTEAKKKAIEYIENLNRINNTRENSLMFLGQPGSGKTHIILGIGKALIEKNIEVVYMPYLEAIRELKNSVLDNEHYTKLCSRYQKAKVLIIDDLFKDKVRKGKLIADLTEADMKHIYPIINYRYLNRLPMLISSECTPNMLLQLDDALAGRILESAANYGIVFDVNCNYRTKNFKGC